MKLKFLILTIVLATSSIITAVIISNNFDKEVELIIRDADWKKTNNSWKKYVLAAGQVKRNIDLPKPGTENIYFVKATYVLQDAEKPTEKHIVLLGKGKLYLKGAKSAFDPSSQIFLSDAGISATAVGSIRDMFAPEEIKKEIIQEKREEKKE